MYPGGSRSTTTGGAIDTTIYNHIRRDDLIAALDAFDLGVAGLGPPEAIGKVFAGFQKYLYAVVG